MTVSSEAPAVGQPRLDERTRPLRLAMQQPDAYREGDVEAALAEL